MDLGLTQAEAARRWGLPQPYVSLVEQGRRPVPGHLVAALGPPVVPAGERHRRTSTDLGVALGNLGYPGFRYLANGRRFDPAAVVERLREVECELEEVRLVRERPLGRRLAEAEDRHVRAHRSALARHWRVLSELTVDDVATAAA